MKRLEFGPGRVYTTDQILANSSFSRREAPILDGVIRTFRRAAKCGAEPIVIGGSAARLYIGGQLTCKVAKLEATDVDIVLPVIPDHLTGVLERKRIVESSRTEYGSQSDPKVTVVYGDYEFYVFPDKPAYKDLQGVDVFHEAVCETRLVSADFSVSRIFSVDTGDGNIVQIKLPDLGLLLATMIDPQSATVTRLRRTVYMLATRAEESRDAGVRYGEVLKRGNLPKEKDFLRVLRGLLAVTYREQLVPVMTFIEGVKESLGISAEIKRN